MPEKKVKKPHRSIRYLLSADRRLRKLSLRKMVEPATKSKEPRSQRPKGTARAMKGPGFASVIGEWGLVLGVVAVVAGVVIIGARQSSLPADVVRADIEPETEAPSAPRAMTARPDSGENSSLKSTTKPPAVARVPTPSTAAAPASAVRNTDAATVTITGCLELDDETFWLRDVSGVDVPRSRSWRSGFLKKRPPSIELVADGNTLRLSNHVGQRVAATGTLMDREMQARTLTRVAMSCQ